MSYRDTILADSPVGYWRLGEVSGTSANDETAANNDGTYVSGYTLGETGAINDGDKAVLFSSGYMTIPYTAALQLGDGPLTIEFWCKLTSLNAAEAKVLDITGTGAYQITTDGSGGYALNKAGLAPVITLDTTVSAGTWHHIVFTKNATAMHGYLDGVEHSGTPANATLTNATGPVVLAKHRSSASDYLPGTLDEVAIYNTVLSLTQVAAHYSAATASPPSSAYATAVLTDTPLIYYRCDAASGTSETDLGSLAKTGLYGGGFTLNQTGALAGDTDKACALNGTTLSRLQIGAGTQLALGDVFSIEVWIKPASVTTVGYLFSESGTGNPPRMWMADGTPRIYIGGLTSGVIATNQTDLVVGTWYHVVWTKSGATNHLYVNGVDDIGTVTNATIETPTGGGDAFWGIGPDGINSSYNGTLDEVAVYNTALSSARVVAHHDAGTGSSSPDREGSFVLTTATYATGYSIPPVPANLANHTWTLQQACTNMGTGAAFGVPAYTYSETVTPLQNQRLVGYPGAIIDGGGTRAQGLILANSGTIIDGFEVTNHIPALQDGAVRVNADSCQILNTRIHDNTGPGIRFASTNALVQDCELDHNIEEGWCTSGASCSGLVMRRVHGHHNNEPVAYNYGGAHTIPIPLRPGWYWPCDPFWEAGVGKVTRAGPFLFEDCEINNNGGVGIWGDITADDFTVRNCRIYENDLAGIMFEISDGAVIEDNDVWSNGKFDHRGWAFDANILVSSALNATVQRNIVAHGKAGISIATQNRADKPANSGSNIHLYDNVVCMPAKQIGWYDDWGGGWPGRIESGNVIYPSQTAERDAILNAHNIPLVEGVVSYADAISISTTSAVVASGFRLASHNAAIATVAGTTFLGRKGGSGAAAIVAASAAGFQGSKPSAPTPQASLTVKIDWNNDGDFGEAGETIPQDRIISASWTRGRSADFSAEATGQATLVLRNEDDYFTPGHPAIGPSDDQLVPGRPVHITGTFAGVDYPQFFGYIERLSYNPKMHTCTITTYDPLRRFEEVEGIVPANDFVQRTARDFRLALYDELNRGNPNLCQNPSFETNTNGWARDSGIYGSLTRVADAAPTVGGSWCGEWHSNGGFNWIGYQLRFLPATFASQTYRVSFWIKWISGTQAVRADLIADPAYIGGTGGGYGSETHLRSVTISPTNTWTRVTFTYALQTTNSASSTACLAFRIGMPNISDTAATVRIDGLMVTRGAEDIAYSDTGVVGRWPNWCGNGSFDASALNGWYTGWTNLIGNPSFESPVYGGSFSTTGWSVAADSFHAYSDAYGGAIVDSVYGSIAGLHSGSYPSGMHYAITGTFLAGHTYIASAWCRVASGNTLILGIGSNGTPTDTIKTQPFHTNNQWQRVSVSWVPTANRTDAHFYIGSPGYYMFGGVDSVVVTEMDGARYWSNPIEPVKTLPYCTAGGTYNISSVAKFGAKSQSFATYATAGAGRLYDFYHQGSYFYAGQPYTASLWLRPDSSMSYRVGMMADKHDGTWDTATVTGTANPNVWTQVVVTWTPTADRSSLLPMDVMLFVEQTDATARTFLIDGVRVIPGSSADDFEPATWDLAIEPDRYVGAASLNGSILAGLSQINALTLSRHWTEPIDSAPWYKYVVNSRDDFMTKASSETYNEDISDLTTADIDRKSIVNRVTVAYNGGSEIYTDAASIAAYGVRPTGIGRSDFVLADTTEALGTTFLAMRKDPRSRPTMIVDNRFPSQLIREVNDVFTLTMARRGIVAARYNIQSLTTTVTLGGRLWHTAYIVEEHPF